MFRLINIVQRAKKFEFFPKKVLIQRKKVAKS